MLMTIPLGIYFLTPIVLVIFNRARLNVGYQWFLALGAAALAWLLLVFSYLRLPLEVTLPFWQLGSYQDDVPVLLLDSVSWSYAVAVATLALAVLLTDAARTRWFKPMSWASGLAFTGFGLLAILAQNPMVLLPAWAAIDLIETWILLNMVSSSAHRERVVVVLTIRLAGIFFLMLAVLRAHFQGFVLAFDAIPPEAGGYLLLAVGVRLGILPPHQAFLKEPRLSRNQGTIVRLIPIASTLVLLTRVADVGAPSTWTPYLAAAALVAALYGSAAWVRSKNELDGRPFWILGMAALAFASSVYGQPIASMAWGIGLLFSGSILFLMSYRVPKLLFPGFLGLVGISALPYAPTWEGARLYGSIPWILLTPFLLAHVLIVLGYVRFALHHHKPDYQLEPWAWVLYLLGLTLLPVMHFGLGWTIRSNTLLRPNWGSMAAWGGVLAVGLATLAARYLPRRLPLPARVMPALQGVLSLSWLYGIIWWVYRAVGKLLAAISLILEGEGGVLWALLMLILLISVMAQRGVGG